MFSYIQYLGFFIINPCTFHRPSSLIKNINFFTPFFRVLLVVFVKGVDGRVRLLSLNLEYKLGKSYVIKAPTGSGKTTWVLFEVFKKVLENGWKCFYTTSLRKGNEDVYKKAVTIYGCLLYTSPSPRDLSTSRMPSSA